MAEGAAASRTKLVVSLVLLVVALSVLVSLGTWQVRRLHWKEALIADIEVRRALPPAPLSDIEAAAARGEDFEYRPVRVEGRFLNDRERHFFATFDGRTGYYVYTPFELDGGRFLFVNRGFVPYEMKDPASRREGLPEGRQTVTGLARARLAGKPSWVVPENDVAGDIFYWKDLSAMAASAGLAEQKVVQFFVDADATPVPGSWPKGGVTQIDLPNDHLQYAITWYGLAVVLLVIALTAFLRGRKPE